MLFVLPCFLDLFFGYSIDWPTMSFHVPKVQFSLVLCIFLTGFCRTIVFITKSIRQCNKIPATDCKLKCNTRPKIHSEPVEEDDEEAGTAAEMAAGFIQEKIDDKIQDKKDEMQEIAIIYADKNLASKSERQRNEDKAKEAKNRLRPGEVKRYDKKLGRYVSNKD